MTTLAVSDNKGVEEGGSGKVNEAYYSKNYRRFLEHR